MRNKGLVLLAGVALLLLVPMPSLASGVGVCPPTGDANDCNLLITINGDGSVTLTNPDPNAYDGLEDQLVGVQNNTSQSIGTITLTGSGIFGFDRDGATTFNGLGPFGPTGYEGPGTSFSGISADLSSGNVNFSSTTLPAGGFAWFSLEEGASTVGTTVTVGTTPTPEPGTMVLLGTGMAAALARYRRRRKV